MHDPPIFIIYIMKFLEIVPILLLWIILGLIWILLTWGPFMEMWRLRDFVALLRHIRAGFRRLTGRKDAAATMHGESAERRTGPGSAPTIPKEPRRGDDVGD